MILRSFVGRTKLNFPWSRKAIPSFQRWASKAKPTQPVAIPAVITAKALSKALDIPMQKVVSYARSKNFFFYKPSELILDFHHAAEFTQQLGREAYYEEVDVVRRDYWDPDNNSFDNPRRPMVVSVMGHVDHGKTTLMDHLRKANVAENEPGKITQSLTAFTVNLKKPQVVSPAERWKYSMTMLDTPGHADFFLMRENGASVSDFLVLIIAANEGLKPQTAEVLSISADSNLPVIVCINKIDISTEKQVQQVYKDLHKIGTLDPKITHDNNPYLQNSSQIEKMEDESFPVKGVIEISALLGTNIQVLIRALFEKADLIDDFLHPSATETRTEATVIESNTQEGIGKTLRVIVHLGCLEAGQWFVTDRYIGRIKCLYDDQAKIIEKAYPGDPVSVAGLKGNGLPPTGAGFFVLPQKEAEIVNEHRENLIQFKFKEMNGLLFRRKPVSGDPEKEPDVEEQEFEPNSDLEEGVLEEENAPNMKWKRIVTTNDSEALPMVVKADNIGRLETLLGICDKLAEEGQININIIANGVGNVTISDLHHVQVEVEENEKPLVPVFCFGEIGLDAGAKSWVRDPKNRKITEALYLGQHKVVYELIDDMKRCLQEEE